MSNYVVEGVNKILEIEKDRVILKTKGIMYSVFKNLKDEKIIYFSNISSIQLKKAGTFNNGYLEVSFYGGQENNGYFNDKYNNENAIVFNIYQQNDFFKVKEYIDNILKNLKEVNDFEVKQTQFKNDNEYLIEIEKLFEMKNKGIITEEEFYLKKRSLLKIEGDLKSNKSCKKSQVTDDDLSFDFEEIANGHFSLNSLKKAEVKSGLLKSNKFNNKHKEY